MDNIEKYFQIENACIACSHAASRQNEQKTFILQIIAYFETIGYIPCILSWLYILINISVFSDFTNMTTSSRRNKYHLFPSVLYQLWLTIITYLAFCDPWLLILLTEELVIMLNSSKMPIRRASYMIKISYLLLHRVCFINYNFLIFLLPRVLNNISS